MGMSRRSILAGATAAVFARPTFSNTDEVETLVSRIRDSLMDGQAGVEAHLQTVMSDPGALLRILGEPIRGGITPLYNDFQITIFNIVWSPLMVLRPHDHNMWASIGVYSGREDNIFWEPDGGSIRPKDAGSFGIGDVGSLPEDAIHSVINPMMKLTGAIHVYGGDFYAPGRHQWEGEALVEKAFDQRGLLDHFEGSNERFGI